jgi:hypothetical protein
LASDITLHRTYAVINRANKMRHSYQLATYLTDKAATTVTAAASFIRIFSVQTMLYPDHRTGILSALLCVTIEEKSSSSL